MILEVSWDGLWTLSFGLSQSHGHGSCVKWPFSTPYEFSNGCFHRNIGSVRMQVNILALYLLPFSSPLSDYMFYEYVVIFKFYILGSHFKYANRPS